MRAECPVCGNDRENLTNKVGQWQCGACKHIWHPNAPKPAPAPVAEAAPVAQPAQQPKAVRQPPRENAAKQIRTLHLHLKARVPQADDAVLRELALDIHQAMADAVALGRLQTGIDALRSE